MLHLFNCSASNKMLQKEAFKIKTKFEPLIHHLKLMVWGCFESDNMFICCAYYSHKFKISKAYLILM